MAVSLERRTGIVALIYWIWDGIDRTIFTAIKFSFPSRFVSPFGFLGMLTFVVFIILGVSGALLMFYYQPILDRAWDKKVWRIIQKGLSKVNWCRRHRFSVCSVYPIW